MKKKGRGCGGIRRRGGIGRRGGRGGYGGRGRCGRAGLVEEKWDMVKEF